MWARECLRVAKLILIIIIGLAPLFLWVGHIYALRMTNRSITLSTATPSAVASHDFQFTLGSTTDVGSIVFEYCNNSPLFDVPCNPAPAGLSLSGAVLSQQTGNTGFVIDNIDSTASKLIISRVPSVGLAVPSNYNFDNIINPSGGDETSYVRISTYTSTQGTGPLIDYGAVAFSTTTNFEVGAFVPPYLNICVGVTVAGDCSNMAGDSLDLGILSNQATRFATSQFAASTNSNTGCAVYSLGTTMTSGNNVIPGMFNQANQTGVSEFGINLRANNKPIVGQDPSGAGTSIPTANFNTPNSFSFVPGSQLSDSSTATDYNRMTVSYIVNVNGSQPAGVYSTTLTYLASAEF
ncbi:MAG TPA: hypothetical protein VLF79_02355 [Candidatus Saccharimonadales bacterium]|nr:hypothetical protein [Candidatus Saccharimonadales bacterium]